MDSSMSLSVYRQWTCVINVDLPTNLRLCFNLPVFSQNLKVASSKHGSIHDDGFLTILLPVMKWSFSQVLTTENKTLHNLHMIL